MVSYDVYWRGHTTEKLNKLRGATKEQVCDAIMAVLEKSKEIKLKVKKND